MGSDVEPADDPEEVKELGVEAAVFAPEDEADWEDATEVVEELVEAWILLVELADWLDSGRWALIQGCSKRSRRLGRSLGLTLRHLRIMSWHSWERRVRNRTSALQIASSFS